ncbi:MAG: aspartate aminotransferase family protein, partial [Halomonas sp.]|nr:aspartate aminotransferase family protein [Halomonas sp.]
MFDLQSNTTPQAFIDEQNASPSALNQHYWMPFSANRDFRANPRMITGAEGRYYIDDQGRKLFDS